MKQVYSTFPGILRNLAAAFVMFAGLTPLSGQAQSITLLSPNGGEAWVYGTMREVSWVGDSLSSMLRLEFSPDGGNTWGYFAEVPSAPDGGIFPVFAPNYNSTNALLRITDFSNPSVTNISDAPFTVTVPAINIYQPATGSVVFANTLTYVNWIVYAPGISQLNAEISTDNGLTYIPVAQNLNALMGYTYLVLADTPAETAILKLYNAQDPSEFCLSTPFTISQVPVYTLTSPSGGEIVNVYNPLTISWTVENSYSDNCDLEFSTDNGETWAFLNNATSTGNSGSYVWTTPNLNSEECVIRIRDIYAFTSMDTSAAFTILPFPETPLCMVTADSLTNYNVIVWEKPASGLIEDFLVYRETSQANVYEVIDTVGYNEEPVVTDFGSNPALRPYRYKVGFMDSENRVFPAGDYHQTIHLTISQGIGGNMNLVWTPYTGFDFSSYNILRKTGSGDYEQIATISSSFSSYTDFDAPSENVAYIVAIDRPGICNTSLRDNGYTQVRSNKASLNAVSVAQIPGNAFSIYPVPANDHINIQFGNNAKGNINLTITDLAGRIIISAEYSDIVAGQVLPINTSDYSEGLYLLNMITSGERIARKFIIQH